MKKIVLSAVLFGSTLSMMAGGYLTNTNQSVVFLRNPAQDANINLNGVYSNPAGVNFLQPGFHFGINLQSAYQTREIQSAFKPFEYGIRNNDSASKTFKAEAKAPVIPSLQGAWVNGPLSLQVNLALVGGGGKATYNNGLGSFESKVALLGAIGNANHALGFNRYDVDAYMHGRQYFYGLTLGAGYRIGEHFSIYGGVRGVLAAAHYDGYLRNIQVNGGDRGGNKMVAAPEYFGKLSADNKSYAETNGRLAFAAQKNAQTAAAEAQAASASGNITLAQSKSAEAKEQAQLAQTYNQKLGAYRQLAYTTGALAQATQDVSINVHQHAFGLAPIVGAHFHNRFLDVAAKYEFRTRIAFANESKNSATTAAAGDQFAAFADKTEVRSDIPALLTLGVRVRPVESLRLNLGYHYYFDKQAKSGVKNAYKNDLLDHGTQEFLAGAEYDLNRQWEVSAGMQRTLYPNNDRMMNDVSFNVNSYSVGVGVGFRLNDHVKLNAAYFRTFYENYLKKSADYHQTLATATKIAAVGNGLLATKDPNEQANILRQSVGEVTQMVQSGRLSPQGADLFTRTNHVFGLSAEFRF